MSCKHGEKKLPIVETNIPVEAVDVTEFQDLRYRYVLPYRDSAGVLQLREFFGRRRLPTYMREEETIAWRH